MQENYGMIETQAYGKWNSNLLLIRIKAHFSYITSKCCGTITTYEQLCVKSIMVHVNCAV